MRESTQRQREVLAFIAQYIDAHAFPPTIREIAHYFTISVKGAHDHVASLKKGYLKYGNERSRALEILKIKEMPGFQDLIKIQILGIVSAGQPSLAEEHWDGFITLHSSILKKSGEYFVLTIRGDSMDGAGILDGDMAIVKKQDAMQNGEIAVVQVDDKVTLKRLFQENDRVRLQPENPDYSSIYCTKDIWILGRLVAVIRSIDAP